MQVKPGQFPASVTKQKLSTSASLLSQLAATTATHLPHIMYFSHTLLMTFVILIDEIISLYKKKRRDTPHPPSHPTPLSICQLSEFYQYYMIR